MAENLERADAELTQGDSILGAFRADTPRGRAAIASTLLLAAGVLLGVFASAWFLVLLVPAAVLSTAGLRGVTGGSAGWLGRMASTGLVMTVNGILLIVLLIVVGFVEDFLLAPDEEHLAEPVVFGFTAVHIILGIGLLLVDHYRHRHG